MARQISVRDLRNHTARVVAAVQAGERLSLTVNRAPVADIVPHEPTPSPWVPSARLREIVAGSSADPALLDDLKSVRDERVEDV